MMTTCIAGIFPTLKKQAKEQNKQISRKTESWGKLYKIFF
jgi:hypothetical protein